MVNIVELWRIWSDILSIINHCPYKYWTTLEVKHKSSGQNPVVVVINIFPIPQPMIPYMSKLLKDFTRSVLKYIFPRSPILFKVFSYIKDESVGVEAYFNAYKDDYKYEFSIGFECYKTNNYKLTCNLFAVVDVIDDLTGEQVDIHESVRNATEVSEDLLMELYGDIRSKIGDVMDERSVRYIAESLIYVTDGLIKFGKKVVKDVTLYMLYP